ncbi:hypothetical protein L596_008364 [Steinernema carpocapsae]|uniref:Tyrosinase copper-binding domain-containing protein n=1 Tax=Steinernema carpocapsae TaxID=34508 RepID=A0A4U5PCS0_STECR|nr:hypothetical protein L596_008364 [Steinernema carpocapsae]
MRHPSSRRLPSAVRLLSLFGLLAVGSNAETSNICLHAPSAAARIVCQQLHKWDTKVRAHHHSFSSFSVQSSSSHSSSSSSSSASSNSSSLGGEVHHATHSSQSSSSHQSSSSSSAVSVVTHSRSSPPDLPLQISKRPTQTPPRQLLPSRPPLPESDVFQIETNREFQAPERGDYVRSSPIPAPQSAPIYSGPTEVYEIMNPFFTRNTSDPFECMDMKCLCPFLRGHYYENRGCIASDGSTIGRAVRMEYRMLSDSQRQRFHEALNRLKSNGIFDRFVREHQDAEESGGAHSGPAFLPWHREYLKRFEIALRLQDHTVAIPYWDSTLDECLQNPLSSVLFTNDFAGSNEARSGYVRDGPFATWNTVEGQRPIRRHPGIQGRLLLEADIDAVLQAPNVVRVLAYTAPQGDCPHTTDWSCLEYSHGNVHVYIGGDMFDPSTSANDPLFHLHHSFVDLIWENYRKQRQNARDRELHYPMARNTNCSSQEHFDYFPMRPFRPLRNIDGLSNSYTDHLYEFAERPSCARTGSDRECGSKYLFCDISRGQRRCAPKLQDNAMCGSYGDQGCLSGSCRAGRCTTTTRRTTITTRNNSFANIYKIKPHKPMNFRLAVLTKTSVARSGRRTASAGRTSATCASGAPPPVEFVSLPTT